MINFVLGIIVGVLLAGLIGLKVFRDLAKEHDGHIKEIRGMYSPITH